MFSTLKPYIQIARPDHWFKNVFVIPGAIMAILLTNIELGTEHIAKAAVGIAAVCLVASANYVINEVLDAKYDRLHPVKKNRPAAAGLIDARAAVIEWVLLAAVALGLSLYVNLSFVLTNVAFLILGLLYNVPPVRTKDVPFLDVLSESANNAVRLMLGWFIITPATAPPLSAVISYWMLGAFFMAAKRLAESRELADRDVIKNYRKSLSFYTYERILISMFFYATAFAFMGAAFIVRYRFELVLLVFPMAALLAEYVRLTFLPHSPAQYPEKLYKQRPLMLICTVLLVAFVVLLSVNLPVLEQTFSPTYMPHLVGT